MNNTRIKDVMRENAYILLRELINEQENFTIVLWNNNNWDKPLPEDIMKNYPEQIVMNVKEQTLEESYINDDGIVVLNTSFDGSTYSKEVYLEEIIVIMGIDGKPYILNDFEQDIEDVQDSYEDLSTKDKMLLQGISEEDADRSLSIITTSTTLGTPNE